SELSQKLPDLERASASPGETRRAALAKREGSLAKRAFIFRKMNTKNNSLAKRAFKPR
ncbi:hypothetical protein A2U01_0066506, partial [Trifolium medium]|nr:hypothetical protein [Trifolium medium]